MGKKCGSGCGPSICGLCNTNPCGCRSSCRTACQEIVPASPSPYYAQAGVCLENHSSCTEIQTFYASVKVANAFNMPDCDQSAALNIPGLKTIAIGSYLWNSAVGYLQVVSFDAYNEIVTVQNNCNTGNASPGTTVPVCSVFVVVDPPSESGGGPSPSGIFVAVDFTAPADGDCLLITVTGVDGLAVGKNVAIGSGVYRLQAINSSTTITICNDGDGITPGSAVIARNGAGQYQYPITLIDVNACSNPAVASGAVVVCKDSLSQPLSGTAAGQVLMLIDEETNEAEYRTLDVPTRTCATILCCLTIVNGFAGPYIISVSDSSEFTVGDILQIGSRTDRVTVTAIDDATTIRGTISPVPSATVDIALGTSICIIECCEDLQNQIDVIDEEIDDIQAEIDGLVCAQLNMKTNNINSDIGAEGIDVTINNQEGNDEYLGPLASTGAEGASLEFTNPSDCRNMVAHWTVVGRIYGHWAGGGGGHKEAGTINVGIRFSSAGSGFTVIGFRKSAPDLSELADYAEDFEVVWHGTQVMAPSSPGPAGVFQVDAGVRVAYESGDATYIIESVAISVTGIATTD